MILCSGPFADHNAGQATDLCGLLDAAREGCGLWCGQIRWWSMVENRQAAVAVAAVRFEDTRLLSTLINALPTSARVAKSGKKMFPRQ